MADNRGLVAQKQHQSYTLPLIEDMLQKQIRQRILMMINLKHAYHQMALADESLACTAMSTPLAPFKRKGDAHGRYKRQRSFSADAGQPT